MHTKIEYVIFNSSSRIVCSFSDLQAAIDYKAVRPLMSTCIICKQTTTFEEIHSEPTQHTTT